MRVQQGFMMFSEFVQLHIEEEQGKIDSLREKGEWDQENLALYYLNEINATPSLTGMATISNTRGNASPKPGRKSPMRAGQASPPRYASPKQGQHV